MIIEAPYRNWRGELQSPPEETLELVRSIVGDEEVSDTSTDARCHVPTRQRKALAVQLYSLWSSSSTGIGDLADAAALARAAPDQLLLLSPLHAPLPGIPQPASPYFPSSRQFRNPLHLRVPNAPARRPAERIDRDEAWTLKMAALETTWRDFNGDERFDAFRAARGDELSRYATFCALCEVHGRPWQEWPTEVRHPDGRGVAAFAVGHADRIRFHEWVQWQLDMQVAELGVAGAGIVNDVAVGFDPAGADAWMWQDLVAPGVHIGAPPDEFNREGQDWGLPPFVPTKLATAGYRPILAALETAFAHAAGLRVDHVMGLFRQYWIPEGAPPTDGVYVHYPAPPLLDAIAIESRRAGAFVVGEDLGTVEAPVREELARRGVLSYKVLWFEQDPPARWPSQALASVTTHDLPTIAGVCSGKDASDELEQALRRVVPDYEGRDVDDVVRRVHAALAAAPSVIISRTLEDVLGVVERPNRPGTDDPDNWSRPLPLPLEDITF